MSYKLDLFDTLRYMDNRDAGFYDRLTTEQRKGFSIPLFLRGMSAVTGDPRIRDWYILSLNDRANLYHEGLRDHPELQYRLMASCGIGSVQRHYWIDMPKKLPKADALFDFIEQLWPGSNRLESENIIAQIDDDKLLSLIRESAISVEDEKEIVEAYERYTGRQPRKAKKKAKGKSRT